MVDHKDFCTVMKCQYQDKDEQLVQAECVRWHSLLIEMKVPITLVN